VQKINQITGFDIRILFSPIIPIINNYEASIGPLHELHIQTWAHQFIRKAASVARSWRDLAMIKSEAGLTPVLGWGLRIPSSWQCK
jgi:hypothetical protein